jgi:hypothetical protein
MVAAVAFSVGAAEARAECGPDYDPAVCQYVEDIPTSKGSQASGAGGAPSGGSGPTSAGLSPSAAADVESKGGKDAKRLKAVAVSPAYGAPTHAPDPSGGNEFDEQRLDSGSALSAAASAVGSGEGTLVGLITALVLISFASLALAARRAGLHSRRRA